MTWCYHDGLTKGEWEIIGHKPVEGKIDMPYFWTQDAFSRKFYLEKGTDTYECEHTGIEISKDEVENYDSYGIGNRMSIRKIYLHRLRKLNLI